MAEHIWSVLCTKHLIDPQANIISLVDVLEMLVISDGEAQLASAKAEGKHGIVVEQPMQVVTYWCRSDPGKAETSKGRVAFHDPEGKKLTEIHLTINLQHDWGGYRHTANFGHVPVTGFGMYWFVVEQKRRNTSRSKNESWVRETRIPLQIQPRPGHRPTDF
jgi:hypothetical protein